MPKSISLIAMRPPAPSAWGGAALFSSFAGRGLCSRMTFSGLTSRWMTPCSCAWATALRSSTPREAATSGGSVP